MSNAFTSTAQNIANKYQAAYNEELSKDYGLNFGIISNSLTAHLLYAAQATSKEMKDKERASQFASEVTGNPMEQLLLSQFNVLYPLYTETVEPALLKILSEYYSYIVSLFSKELSRSFDGITGKFNLDKSNSYISFSSNPKESLLKAIETYPNNGNVIGFAILNGILDEELCLYGYNAPKKFDLRVSTWATDYLCNIYNEGKMFNKPLVNEQTQTVLNGLTTYCQYGGKDLESNILWQSVIENVYLESITSISKSFEDLCSSQTEKGILNLAKARRKISVTAAQRNTFIDLCNTLNSKTILTLSRKLRLSLPVAEAQLLDIISTTNKKIDDKIVVVKEQERVEQERAEKRRQEESTRQAEENYRNKKVSAIGSLVTGIAFALFTIINFSGGEQIRWGIIFLIISVVCFFASKSFFKEWNILRKQRETREDIEKRKSLFKRVLKKSMIIGIIVIVLIVSIILTNMFLIKPTKYSKAINLWESGEKAQAVQILSELGDYKDSENLVLEYELSLMKNINIGDTVKFGRYSYSSGSKNEIEWIVVAKNNSKIALVSKYCLDVKPFHKEADSTSWDNCSLNKWLNLRFINDAFNLAEKSIIEPYASANNSKVFILSSQEAENWFNDYSDRRAEPTPYAKSKGSYEGYYSGNNTMWWLRTQGYFNERVYVVDTSGDVSEYKSGVEKNDSSVTVRPAIWINIDSKSPIDETSKTESQNQPSNDTQTSNGTSTTSKPTTTEYGVQDKVFALSLEEAKNIFLRTQKDNQNQQNT